MLKVFELIRRVGPANTAVLVTGESGTGKELVARALHELSPRKARSFVPVHCGAIPEELLESELFGHVRGAFTGALTARTGRFQLGNGGTIFLDEIGEMSQRFQVKLLRVLEDGTFEPVGSTTTLTTDVRMIAATHRDLRAMADQGTFRKDLLYRMDVLEIHLPPLRERREDIPLIAQHFLSRIEAANQRPGLILAEETVDILMRYEWPGNVRELRNVLERAALLGETPEQIRACDLPPAIVSAVQGGGGLGRETLSEAARPWDFGLEGANFYTELEGFELRMIGRALQLAGGSKREAARLLQVNRTTLLEKLKRRGWEVQGGRLGRPTVVPPSHESLAENVRRAPASYEPSLALADSSSRSFGLVAG
jgi:DNA-binding NtrC family response regulator